MVILSHVIFSQETIILTYYYVAMYIIPSYMLKVQGTYIYSACLFIEVGLL